MISIILYTLYYRKKKGLLLNTQNNPQPSRLSKREIIQKITIGAILISLAAVFKTFSFSTGEMRLGFYEIPVLLSGFLLGPLFGSLVGLGSDLIYSLFSGYSFSPIMMCSAMIWGLVGGLFYKRKGRFLVILVVCLLTGILTTAINSLQLYLYYGMGMWGGLPLRIMTMLVKWPIISTIVWFLNSRVLKLIVKK